MSKKIDRKDFLKTSVIVGASIPLILSGCKSEEGKTIEAPHINTNKSYKWKMVTTWPPNFPVLGEGANMYAQWINEMSAGQIQINVYGGGTLAPALEVFDAVTSGAVEMGSGASYYWGGKDPSFQMFTTVPFGMNAQQMNSWLYSGGGLKLWEELYAKFNLVPFPGGNTGVQMAGWFNREINTIDDFKGLKMRMPGLGARVLEKAGGTAVLSSGSELYTNLERGVIDATEWIGPYHDYLMGFHNISKYYYSPGWHEPGSNLEIIINKRLYDGLSDHLKGILQAAAYRLNMWVLSEFEAKNNEYLKKIVAESAVEVRQLNPEILETLKGYTDEVMEEVAAKNDNARRVFTAYKAFQKDISEWSQYSETNYHKMMSK